MKLEQKETINRLVIYFFYDADGIVDRYVPYMLEDINKNCSELFVVCNGKLTPEGRKTFLKLTPNLMVRVNIGFDVWAYKEALEHYGWEKLAEFDEVVLMNHTIMGPVYPFSEMFEEMNRRDLDFWGITKFHKMMSNPYNTPYGYLPEHIQSHFIAVRSPMLQSKEFHRYWEERPEIKSYADSVGKHESLFTKAFSDFGFTWDCYINPEKIEKFTHYPLMIMPKNLIEKHRCPIFKRRSFFQPCSDLISFSDGNQGVELLNYLRDKTNYDVSMIWENILRTNNMADIKNSLSLNYILPLNSSSEWPKDQRIALIIHSYFDDLIEYIFQYALSMPADSDIYITTDSVEKKQKIEEIFLHGPWHSIKVIQIENRGRDISSLLVGVKPYLNRYDYICFVHDKKVDYLDYGSKGFAFSERCFHNLLGSPQLVRNIVELFENNPYLGILCPPTPNHADYYSTLGCEWGYNYDNTKQLFDKLELNCPVEQGKEPVAPFGTMFWFRTTALRKLYQIDWEYSDFPKEPNNTDGSLLHAIERIYPFVAQDAGYYSAWVLSDYYAQTEWNHLSYMLRELNMRMFQAYGVSGFYSLTTTIDYYLFHQDTDGPVPNIKFLLKRKLKSKIPKPIWNLMKKIYSFFGGKKWVG
ncbi:MAG: rhamnan synthesis protein F [Angelakisella sp.]|nr:rhamnan synthesis protein F [Angelakisella sp.]